MMSDTPRVFVGTTTFLIAGMTSPVDLLPLPPGLVAVHPPHATT
jgi:hypothetical protein